MPLNESVYRRKEKEEEERRKREQAAEMFTSGAQSSSNTYSGNSSTSSRNSSQTPQGGSQSPSAVDKLFHSTARKYSNPAAAGTTRRNSRGQEVSSRTRTRSAVNSPKATGTKIKEDTGEWAKNEAYGALTGFNKELASAADFLLPDVITPKKVQNALDYYRNADEEQQKKVQASRGDSKLREVAGTIGGETLKNIPAAAMAILSGGTSVGAQVAGKAVPSLLEGAQIARTGNIVQRAMSEVARTSGQNPMFWETFMRTVGPTYDNEIQNGADPIRATLSAYANALLNAQIEIGGGVEVYDPSEVFWKAALRSAKEEGLEEVQQYAVENLVNKAVGSNTAKWLSMNRGENAVINPIDMAEQGFYGAAAGGLMSGGRTLGVNAVNSIRNDNYRNANPDLEERANELIQRASLQGREGEMATRAQNLAEEVSDQMARGEAPTAYQMRELERAVATDEYYNDKAYQESSQARYDQAVNEGRANTVESTGTADEYYGFQRGLTETEQRNYERAKAVMGEDASERSVAAVGRFMTGSESNSDIDTILLDPKAKSAVEELTDVTLPINNTKARTELENLALAHNIANNDRILEEAHNEIRTNMSRRGGEFFDKNYDEAVATIDEPNAADIYESFFSRFYTAGTVEGADFEKTYNRIISPLVEDFGEELGTKISQVFNHDFAQKVFAEGQIAMNSVRAKAQGKRLSVKASENPAGFTYEAEARKHISDKEAELFTKLAERAKVHIRLVNSIAGGKANGSYDPETGVILIAADSDNKFITVFKHELTHHLKNTSPEMYQKLEDFVFKRWYDGDPEKMEARVQEYQKRYGFRPDEAREEIIADASEAFFTDQGAINDAVTFNEKMARAIHDGIKSLLDTFLDLVDTDRRADKGYGDFLEDLDILRDAEKMWLEALNESVGKQKGSVGNKADLDAFLKENGLRELPQTKKMSLKATEDSEGKRLTEGQKRFFKDSRATDKDGKLVTVYHTTENGGFTVFDPKYSDDKRSLFFASNFDISQTYGRGANRPINPDMPEFTSWDDFENYAAENFRGWDNTKLLSDNLGAVVYPNEQAPYGTDEIPFEKWIRRKSKHTQYDAYISIPLPNGNYYNLRNDSPSGLLKDINDVLKRSNGKGYYACYLNLENPLVVDGHGMNWNKIDTDFVVTDGQQKLEKAADKRILSVRSRVPVGYSVDTNNKPIYKMFLAVTFEEKDANGKWIRNTDQSIHLRASSIDDLDKQARKQFIEWGYSKSYWDNVVRKNSNNGEYRASNDGDYIDSKGNLIDKSKYIKGQTLSGYTNTRGLSKIAKDNGYDGVIIRNIADVGGRSRLRSGASPYSDIYIAFNSNQVKLTSNENPTEDDDIRYSLKDSDGNTLSKGQQEYFKDSKARDENGNLLVLYHGTENAGFTIFDSEAGISSPAFFFTNNLEIAKGYSGTHDIARMPAFKNVEAVQKAIKNDMDADIEIRKEDGKYVMYEDGDYVDESRNLNDLYNLYNQYSGFGGTSSNYKVYLNVTNPLIVDAKGKSWDDITTDFSDEPMTSNAIAEYAKENGYDGVVIRNVVDAGLYNSSSEYKTGTDVIAFNPEQIKDIDNKNPTKDPDIRFSMKTPVEETRKMIAWHNINSSNINGVLELGGLAMPSFAIKPSDIGHGTYGDISIIASKDSIDPKVSKSQMIFGGDAWTPMFPDVSIKASEKVAKRIDERLKGILGIKRSNELPGNLRYPTIDTSNLQDQLQRWGDPYNAYGKNTVLRLAYVMNGLGKQYSLPMKEGNLGGYDKAFWELVDDKLPKKSIQEFINEDVMQYEPILRDIMYETYGKAFDEKFKGKKMKLSNPYKKELSWGKVDGIIYDLNTYRKIGIKPDVDTVALENDLDNIIQENEDGYKRWIDELFDGVIEKKGVRNNKDMFTPSGSRRSWESLHDDYNLANIVKAMKGQSKQGNNSMFTTAGNVKGAALKSYSDIEDVRRDLGRIAPEESEEIKSKYDQFTEDTRVLANRIADDPFSGSEMLADILSHAKTEASIYRFLNREYDFLRTQNHLDLKTLATDIYNLGQLANTLPMEYFESKIYRAYPLQEALAIVVPDNLDSKTVDKIKEYNGNILTYKAGNEEDRLAKVNSVEGAKFSLKSPDSFREDMRGLELWNKSEPEEYFNKATGFYSQYQKGEANKDNFFKETIATFEQVKGRPHRKPDYTSIGRRRGRIITSSEYWYTNDGVIRGSNHWGTGIASCDWALKETNGNTIYGALNGTGDPLKTSQKYGKAKWSDFILKTNIKDDGTLTTFENQPEGKYSLKDLDSNGTSRSYQSTITKLENQVKDLKSEFKRTDLKTADQKQVRIQAGKLITRHGSNMQAQKSLIDTFNEIFRLYKEKGTDAFDEVYEIAKNEAVNIVNNISVVHNEGEETYKAIKDYLRNTPITISEDMKRNITDFNDFRKRYFGKLKITNGNTTNIDTVYMELMELFPEQFTEDYVNLADQLYHMADVLDNYAPYYETLDGASEEMQDYVVDIASDIMETAYGLQTKKTFADKKYEEKVRAVEKARQKALESRDVALDRQKKRYEKKLNDLKQHNKDVREGRRERKEESELRSKLLKVARRLDKMKTTKENRTLIQNLIGDMDLVAKSMTGKTLNDLNDLRNWYDEQKEADPFFYDSNVEAKLKRLTKKQIANMDLNDVRDLNEVLRAIETSIRNADKFLKSYYNKSVKKAGLEVIEDVNNSKGVKDNPLGTVDRFFINGTLSPERQIHRITGYNDNDPLYVATKELSKGQRDMLFYQMNSWNMFKKFMKDKQFINSLNGKKAREIELSAISKGKETTIKVTPDVAISLYLSSMNDDNMRHMGVGGVEIPEIKAYKNGELKKAYRNSTRVTFSKEQLAAIEESLTKQEKAFADTAHEYYNSVAPKAINEVSEILKGYSLAQVENYFPIQVNKNFLDRDFESLKFDGTIEGMGSLKERVKASNPIVINGIVDTITRSINENSMYVGLAIPVRNYSKLLGVKNITYTESDRGGKTETKVEYNGSVNESISKKWGDQAMKYIEKFMTDLQTSRGSDDDWEAVLNKWRSNYAGAVLTLNASVAIKQAASYPTAMAVLGAKPLARAMADVGKVDLDLIEKYTPLQWYRSQGYSTKELGDIRAGRKGSAVDKLTSVPILNWIQAMDVLTTRKLWKASEYYVRQNNRSLKQGSDEYYKAVADIYNRVIEETQPNYTVMQRPGLLRSDKSMVQMLNMFKTQPYQNFNILYDSIGNYKAKAKVYKKDKSSKAQADVKKAYKDMQNAVLSQVLQLAVFAAMTSLWALFRGKDDKWRDEDGKLSIESYMKQLGKDMLSGSAAMIPLGADLYNAISSAITGDYYYGFSSVTDSSISDLFNSLNQTMTLIPSVAEYAKERRPGEPIPDDLKKSSKKLLENTSRFSGIPYSNLRNLWDGVYRWVAIAGHGEYVGEYLSQKATFAKTSVMMDNLFKAYRNDKAQYDELRQMMIDDGIQESSIDYGMKDRMKKNKTEAEQKEYDDSISTLEKSALWRDADAEDKEDYEKIIEKIAVGIKDGDTESYAKLASSGVSEEQAILYKLALKKVDKPNKNGNLGTYTNDEKEAALRLLMKDFNLTAKQKEALKD